MNSNSLAGRILNEISNETLYCPKCRKRIPDPFESEWCESCDKKGEHMVTREVTLFWRSEALVKVRALENAGQDELEELALNVPEEDWVRLESSDPRAFWQKGDFMSKAKDILRALGEGETNPESVLVELGFHFDSEDDDWVFPESPSTKAWIAVQFNDSGWRVEYEIIPNYDDENSWISGDEFIPFGEENHFRELINKIGPIATEVASKAFDIDFLDRVIDQTERQYE